MSRMVRCQNELDGVRCARQAELVGFKLSDLVGVELAWVCEPCREGGKPYVPRDGRAGQQKQTKRSK